MSKRSDKAWNPYVAGALSGLVSVFSVWLSGKYLGASSTFVRTAAMVESLVAPERVKQLPYFLKNPPQVDWQWFLVAGIFLGSLLAALWFRDFRWQALPPMWEARFGQSRGKRGLVAFVGGVVAMFGARLADG